jgi:hypothetical protein
VAADTDQQPDEMLATKDKYTAFTTTKELSGVLVLS